ncbi:MAG: hypothetical protein ACLP1X_28260 [Polyangiaceae bacterium]
MQWSVGGALAVAVCVTACGALSGLDQYVATDEDSATVTLQPDPDAAQDDDTSTSPPEGEGETSDDAGQDVGMSEQANGDGGADVGTPVDAFVSDVVTKDAARVDSGQPSDAEMAPDNYVCGSTSCGGCCTGGVCAGGQSVATCGVGGVQCKDCTSTGACIGGSCTTPPVEAGPPPMCVASQCTNVCAAAPIQGVCCKSDNTCGCQYTIFAPCN